MLYRITTNSKFKNDILQRVNQKFKSYTVLEGAYYDSGSKQYAIVIEIDGTVEDERKVRLLVGDIISVVGTQQRTDVFSLEQGALVPISPEEDQAEAREKQLASEAKANTPEDIAGRVQADGFLPPRGETSEDSE